MTDIPDDFTRRLGRACISKFLVDDNPRAVMAAFADAIVVRCEFMFPDGRLDYVLCHTAFDPISHGQEMPHYDCVFDMHADGTVTHEWRRMS